MSDNYDFEDDFAKSIDEAYSVIRERKAAGGPGWQPVESMVGFTVTKDNGTLQIRASIRSLAELGEFLQTMERARHILEPSIEPRPASTESVLSTGRNYDSLATSDQLNKEKPHG